MHGRDSSIVYQCYTKTIELHEACLMNTVPILLALPCGAVLCVALPYLAAVLRFGNGRQVVCHENVVFYPLDGATLEAVYIADRQP